MATKARTSVTTTRSLLQVDHQLAPRPAKHPPVSALRRSLRHPAAFSLVVPDNQHNMHTGSIAKSDKWLRHWIPKIIHSRKFRHQSVLFITFDEGHNDSGGCCIRGVHGGRTV